MWRVSSTKPCAAGGHPIAMLASNLDGLLQLRASSEILEIVGLRRKKNIILVVKDLIFMFGSCKSKVLESSLVEFPHLLI